MARKHFVPLLKGGKRFTDRLAGRASGSAGEAVPRPAGVRARMSLR